MKWKKFNPNGVNPKSKTRCLVLLSCMKDKGIPGAIVVGHIKYYSDGRAWFVTPGVCQKDRVVIGYSVDIPQEIYNVYQDSRFKDELDI